MQNKIERLLGWEEASHTISLLFVYSFVCLDPHLLAIIPIAAGLLFIMVPAFLARHPPPPSLSTSSTAPYYSYDGPALAPATKIEPASETSIDFFRNMRDLQNTMGDFSDAHDSIIHLFSPITDFADENLSSTTFLLLTLVAIALFPTAHLLPWRYVLLLGGNAAILSNNPTIQAFFQNLARDLAEEAKDRAVPVPAGVDGTGRALGLSIPSTPSAAMALLGSLADISLDTYPEEREVEIFELQYRSPESHAEAEWDHFLFSSMPYDPLSPSRIAGDRPRGCRFFEDVRPPPGWDWKSKRWELDMDSREWVVERMITGVGLESHGSLDEGGEANEEEVGGWVWDLPLPPPSQGSDEVLAPLGPEELTTESNDPPKMQGKSTSPGKGKPAVRDFEERSVGPHGMGDWRRRRWVRVVHRISAPTTKRKNKSSGKEAYT